MGTTVATRVYNVNVGVLGHVDSGKTSLGGDCPFKLKSGISMY